MTKWPTTPHIKKCLLNGSCAFYDDGMVISNDDDQDFWISADNENLALNGLVIKISDSKNKIRLYKITNIDLVKIK